MNSNGSYSKKARLLLLVSVALNIFLLAFTLGRISVPGLMPPPPFMNGGRHGMHKPMMHNEMPPPFLGPSDLFSPEEMGEDFAQVRKNFAKINELRQAFADRLQKGEIRKDEVLAHFAEVDRLMTEVRTQTQEKAAARISAMTPEDRERFAVRLRGKE